MCGVLYVRSSSPIALERHLAAVQTLEPRGPDFTRYQHRGNVFIAQTVLRITGTDDYYQQTHKDFLSYNGEIYNYRWFGNYSSDTELVHHTVRHDLKKFRHFEGPWAWAWTDFETVLYAADPQGERCLYHYQDDDILIVASEVTAILAYVDCEPQSVPYVNKGWTMISQTPWRGITRCDPGVMYKDGVACQELDSVWNWINPQPMTWQDAVSEFDRKWNQVADWIRPNIDCAISFSAGIDSSIILSTQPQGRPVVIDTIGKDPIVKHAPEFLNSLQRERLCTISVDPKAWAKEYKNIIQNTQMPVQSWSYVGKWLVAKHCDTKVVFTGLAADELFGGYPVYQSIDYTTDRSHSPYSSHDHDGIWHRCLDAYSGDARQATLLMDYWYQVVGVDAPGQDRLGAAWGRETRSPFMTRTMIEFALNLPWQHKVNTVCKPLLRQWFQQRFGEERAYPKMGFAGHANDSLPWLGVSIQSTGDRHTDWQQIAQSSYYLYMSQGIS